MTFNTALRIAAILLFILAALIGFDIIHATTTWSWEGLTATGLACWVGSTLP